MSEAGQYLLCRVAIALVLALAFSPMIRSVTAQLNHTLGRSWPFVLEHCRAHDTPGCSDAEPTALFQLLRSGRG